MEIDAIKKLIETDERVRREIQEEYDKRDKFKQEIEAEKKKISDEAWKAVNQQVEDTRNQLQAKVKADDEKNQAYYARASELLKKDYAENKDKWRKEIYHYVLGSTAKEAQ